MVLDLFNSFYTQLFTSSAPQDLEQVLDGVQIVVHEDMRVDLAHPYTSEEVGVAI